MIKIRGRSLEKKFEKSVIENKEKFYRLAYYYVKNHHDAMDVLQESILKGYSNITKIKDENFIDKYLSRIDCKILRLIAIQPNLEMCSIYETTIDRMLHEYDFSLSWE